MMRLISFLFAVQALCFGQCPDTGSTIFYKSEHGVNGYWLLGDQSYWSLFVGSDFEPANKDGETKFWLDGCFLEWLLVPAKDFTHTKAAPQLDPLTAFFRYESGFLKSNAKKGIVQMKGFADFTPIQSKGHDGITRTFKIWTARLGKGKEKRPQFWIATIHPKGAAVLSIIQAKSDDDAQVHLLIDSYIANFGTVDSKNCEILRTDFEKSKAKTD